MKTQQYPHERSSIGPMSWLSVFVSGLALGVFAYSVISLRRFGIQPSVSVRPLALWGGMTGVILIIGWCGYAWTLARWVGLPFRQALHDDAHTYLPFLLLLAAALEMPLLSRSSIRPFLHVMISLSVVGLIGLKALVLVRYPWPASIRPASLASRVVSMLQSNPLIGILFVAFAIRSYVWLHAYGFPEGDCVEYIDRAYSGVAGAGWAAGREARPLLFPFMLAVPLYITQVFQVHAPDLIVRAMQLVPLLFSLVAVGLTYEIGRRFAPAIGVIGGLLLAINPHFTFWSAMTTTEVTTTTFTLCGYYLLLTGRTSRRTVLAGVAIGLSMWLHHQAALFAVPIGLWQLSRRDITGLAMFSIGFLIGVVGGGFIDYFVYGQFFHSLLASINEVFVKRVVERLWPGMIGPPYWYFSTVLSWFPPLEIGLVLLGLIMWRRAGPHWLIIITVLVFFGFYCLVISFKMYRFLIPVIPFLVLIGARGLQGVTEFLFRRLHRKTGEALFMGSIGLVVIIMDMMTLVTADLTSRGDLLKGVQYVAQHAQGSRIVVTNPYLISELYLTNRTSLVSIADQSEQKAIQIIQDNEFLLTDMAPIQAYPALARAVERTLQPVIEYPSGIVLFQKRETIR